MSPFDYLAELVLSSRGEPVCDKGSLVGVRGEGIEWVSEFQENGRAFGFSY